MAEVKWIKLTVDMFDDEKIKIIQSLPEGDTLLVVWIKLITLAGKTNDGGYVYISEGMPYTDEMLSIIMNKPLNTIRLALDTFTKLGMIEADIKGIYLLNFEKHQSLDKLEKIKEQNRLRVAKYREKKKLELLDCPTGICAYCGKECKTSMDHVIPKSKGGTDDNDNLVECCIECNSSKQDRTLLDFLNNCVYINYVGADIERILNNPKLNRYVDYNGEKFVKRYCNVTVQKSNAIDIDKEEDIEIDIDINKENNKRKKFVKPSIEEVQEYCTQRNNNIDAESFIDYYEANGWKVGKNPMKDWKAAIRTWEKRNTSPKQPTRKEMIPDWMYKEPKKEPLSPSAQRKMEKLLEEFNK